MKYFRLHDFVTPADSWSLDYPRYLDRTGAALNLFDGNRWEDNAIIEVELVRKGTALDYSHAGGAIPVLSSTACKIFCLFCVNNVQVLPGIVGGTMKGFCVVNILRVLKALDEGHSYFEKYEEGERRFGIEKTGCYRWVSNPIIDPSKVPDGVHIFRLFGFGVMIFVSEPLHDAMVQAKLTGAGFDPAF